MGNSMSVWASDVTKSSFIVHGRLNNNGYTYSYTGCRFTLSVNGSDIYDQKLTFSKGQNIEFSAGYNCGASSSARTFTIKSWWDSSGFGYVDSNSATATVTVGASVSVPPAVTKVKLTRNSDTQLTGSWTNNGSGTSAATQNLTDFYKETGGGGGGGTWTNQVGGTGIRTSQACTSSANGKFQFRVSSGNSAGNSATQYSNIVYTTPATPTISSAVGLIYPSAGSLNFSVDTSAANYPSGKINWQYSTNGGSSWSATQTSNGSVVSISSAESTYNSFIMGLKSNSNCYVRAQCYNADNTLASDWSAAKKIEVKTQPIAYVNLPSGATLKGIYINKG